MGALVGGSVAVAANQDKILQVVADVLQRGADQLNSHLEKRKVQVAAEFEPDHLGATQTELETDDGRESSDDEMYTKAEPLASSESTVRGQEFQKLEESAGEFGALDESAAKNPFGDSAEVGGRRFAADGAPEDNAVLSLASSCDLSCGDFSAEDDYMVFKYRSREIKGSEDESWESLSQVSVD